MKEIFERLTIGEELTDSKKLKLRWEHLFSEEITDSEISAFLIGLKAKGETVEEIAGLVNGIRANSLPFKESNPKCNGQLWNRWRWT